MWFVGGLVVVLGLLIGVLVNTVAGVIVLAIGGAFQTWSWVRSAGE